VQTVKPHCIHCGGNLIRDNGERKCLQCGRAWKSLKELHQFYTEHRFEILKDIADLGRPAAMGKWRMPSGTATSLLRSWLHEQGPKPEPAPAKPADDHLPVLPVFCNEWAPEVQVKWLEVWSQRR
jgi:hypothetical protein